MALAVFAILGGLSYRAVSQMSALETRLQSQHEHWRQLSHGLLRLETDLLQLATPPAGMYAVRLEPSHSHGQALDLLVDDGQAERLSQIRIRLVQGQLVRVREATFPLGQPAETEILVDDVDRIEWRFMHRGTWHAQWPTAGAISDIRPDAIELVMWLPAGGNIRRVIALQ